MLTRLPSQRRLSGPHAPQSSCTCAEGVGLRTRRSRLAHCSTSSLFLGGNHLRHAVGNGTCRLSMRQRAFHFEVGTADEDTDEERAFTEFSNLERQTKIVDENRRRRYFESASDYKKRMVSQRYTTIRRARQDSWIQTFSDVFEDEPSPFQDMFEQPGASSLFGGDEYGGNLLATGTAPGTEEFKDRQKYSNGKPEGEFPSMGATLDLSDITEEAAAETISPEEKHAPQEAESVKEGLRKPLAAKARSSGDEAVPRRPPGTQKDIAAQQVVPSQPQKGAARTANKKAQASDAARIETSDAPQGNVGSNTVARPANPATAESLVTNQFDAEQDKSPPQGVSTDTRKPKTKPKGFAGAPGPRRGKASAPAKGSSKAKGQPQLAGKR